VPYFLDAFRFCFWSFEMTEENPVGDEVQSPDQEAGSEGEEGGKKVTFPARVLVLEVGIVLNRTPDKPPMRPVDAVVVPDESSCMPFGKVPAWTPKVWKREKLDHKPRKGEKVKMFLEDADEDKPHKVFYRCFKLIQARMRAAGNKVLRELWLFQDNKEMQINKKTGKLEPVPLSTIAYRRMTKLWFEGAQYADVPELSGATRSESAQRLYKLYSQKIKEVYKGECSFPTLHEGNPVWLRGTDGWAFTREDGLNIALCFEKGSWWELGLRPPTRTKKRDKAGQGKQALDYMVMGHLKKIVAGEGHRASEKVVKVDGKKERIPRPDPTPTCWRPAALGLQMRKDKLYALIQYRYTERPKIAPGGATIVHLGLWRFGLARSVRDMNTHRFGYEMRGEDLFDQENRILQRRRDIQRASRSRVPGRGFDRMRVKKEYLSDKAASWKHDWLRKHAARIVRDALYRKDSVIWVMDCSELAKRADKKSDLPKGVIPRMYRAPWFAFHQYIKQACDKHGLEYKTYVPYYHTQRCPRCKTKDAAAVNYRKKRYNCAVCFYENDIDRMAVENAVIDLKLADGKDFAGDRPSQMGVLREFPHLVNENKKTKTRKSPASRAEAAKG
jgi:hypothetical protein